MSVGHSKGPWRFGSPEGQTGPTTPSFKPFCGGHDWPYAQVTRGQETIAITPAPDDGGPLCCGAPIKAEAEANARLIAAAPELLAMLIRYRTETPLGHQPHMIALEADKLIARATGAA